MPAWLTNTLPTVLICLALAAVVFLILRSMIRKRKNGGSSCGCGCENCAAKSACHPKK